jgi:hypothetical protein
MISVMSASILAPQRMVPFDPWLEQVGKTPIRQYLRDCQPVITFRNLAARHGQRIVPPARLGVQRTEPASTIVSGR